MDTASILKRGSLVLRRFVAAIRRGDLSRRFVASSAAFRWDLFRVRQELGSERRTVEEMFRTAL
jgi:hypothetical protein